MERQIMTDLLWKGCILKLALLFVLILLCVLSTHSSHRDFFFLPVDQQVKLLMAVNFHGITEFI